MGSRKGHQHRGAGGRENGPQLVSQGTSPGSELPGLATSLSASGSSDDLPDELAPPARLEDEESVDEDAREGQALVAEPSRELLAPRASSVLPIVVAPASASRALTPAPVTPVPELTPSALKDLRREVAESHAVVVRTSNSVTTLAASLKEVITRQSRYDRGLNLNSFVAYVLFTALLGAGFFMLYRTRADQLVTERDQALRGQKSAIDEAQVARAELGQRDAAEKKALEYWTLIAGGKREEAIARYPEVLHARLTPVEAQVFEQSLSRARAEIVDAGHAEGLEAFQGAQWKRAAASFKKGLTYEEEGPRAAQMRYYYGVSLHKLGDFSEASRQLELSIAGGAERTVAGDARYYLAGAYEQLRQFDKARSEYEKFANGHSLNPWAGTARRKAFEMGQKAAIQR
jgi:TolA-binding protein